MRGARHSHANLCTGLYGRGLALMLADRSASAERDLVDP